MPTNEELYQLDAGKNQAANSGNQSAWTQQGFTPLVTAPYNAPNGFATSWQDYQNQNSGTGLQQTNPASTTPNMGGGSIPLASLGLGLIQSAGAIRGIKSLQKQALPQFAATADMQKAKARSGKLSEKGFTESQRGAFQQDTAKALNTGFNNSVNLSGGNMANALSGQNVAQRLRSLNQFAVADANQFMNNVRYDDSLTRSMQELQNRNTQYAMQRRQATEQAYGAALKAGTENIVNGLNQSTDISNLTKFMA